MRTLAPNGEAERDLVRGRGPDYARKPGSRSCTLGVRSPTDSTPDGEGESVLPGLHLLSLLGVEVESGTLLSPGENGRQKSQDWGLFTRCLHSKLVGRVE